MWRTRIIWNPARAEENRYKIGLESRRRHNETPTRLRVNRGIVGDDVVKNSGAQDPNQS
jgi:hypothetical protein